MGIYELVKKNRSYRRYYQDERTDRGLLAELVELARLSASGSNKQALKFALISEPGKCDKVFESVLWAGFLKDWDGPEKGEQPSSYIIILGDTSVSKSFGVDHGIAAQSILLGAAEKGLGGCMIGSVKRDKLRDDLSIAGQYEILLVIALGKPKEEVVIEKVQNNDTRYWRDEQHVHHVPKRSLDELIIDL